MTTAPHFAEQQQDAPVSLRVENLAKHYAESSVFRHVTFCVAPGEFVAIVGESGVGKSTLLNCIAGLDDWNAGRILASDARPADAAPGAGPSIDIGALNADGRALWRRRAVGFVFQAFHVLPHLDVAQNVALPLLLLAQPDDARVQHMLDVVGLGGLGNRLPQQLSGGQLQRVAIARALVHRPALLLADEPTGNLDPATAEKVMDVLIGQTRQHQAALVLVTHSAQAAARADRVLHLREDGIADGH